MKIIYSNIYDGQLFVDSLSTDCRFVGSLQLLEIIERELGLYKTYSNNEERLKIFSECLNMNAQNSFYNESLSADQYRVGKELLKIRDELILSEWKSSLPNQPKRFSDLATVDSQFQLIDGFEGNADRWVNVLQVLKENSDFVFDFELIVHDQAELIYPLFRAVFHELNAVYETRNMTNNDTNSNLSLFKESLIESFSISNSYKDVQKFKSLNEDTSLLLLKFSNKQLLVDSIAALTNKEDHLLIANDSSDLDYSMVSFGKNAMGSKQHNSNPKLVQLFKLIIPCFSEFNFHTFISFLQLKDSPIPFELKNKLLKTILEIPGFGNEKWNDILSKFKNRTLCEDKDLDEKQRNEIINLFLTFDTTTEQESIVKAKNIVSYLISWSSKSAHIKQNQLLKEQFHYLNELFVKLEGLIKDEKSLAAIEKAFNIIYESSNFTNYDKQENSTLCIDHLGKLVSACELTVVYTDFYGSMNLYDISKFLLKEEQEYLKQNNCYYNSYNQLNTSILLRGLQHINKQLILCYYEDEKNEKHPYHIRMESLFSDLNNTIVNSIERPEDLNDLVLSYKNELPLISSIQIELPNKTDYFKSQNIKNLTKREVESASSIEKFIQYPFEWVMEYKLKMRAYQGVQLGRDNQLKGNIAHKVIENLFSKLINKQISEFKISFSEFENEFNQVVKQEGVLFLQPEKRFELSEFKIKFQKSFFSLLDVLVKNELTIESCEYTFGYDEPFYLKEIDSFLNGSIDLLLKNKEGNHVVFDLKWTFSDKKYEKKIQNNEEIQLALYIAALKNRANIVSGYYLLNQNKLITTACLLGDVVVKIPSEYSTEVILSKIENSVRFRWEEIKNGRLEIGDGMPMDLLNYQNQKDVIQLPTQDNDKNKKVNPYAGFELFKGQLN